MGAEFNPHCHPQYRILCEDQIRKIHRDTLAILETIGVRVFNEEGRTLLSSAGCRARGDGIFLIPPTLVEESIRSAPSRIRIYDRRGKEAMELEGNQSYFGPGTDLLHTLDLETGQLRRSEVQDVVNAAIIGDYLEEIDFVASFAHPQDISPNLSYVASFKALVENSTKPIFFTAAGYEDLSIIIEMAATVAGGERPLMERPFLIHYSEPTSPLSHSDEALRKLFLCAEKKIPICYVPAVLSGASGPVTLAGAIAQANAEALSGVVLHQLRSKGAPIISGFAVAPMDMRAATCVYGSPEYRLALSACADLYHWYRIPVWGTAGCSDANILDTQAAMEFAFSLLTAALDGANLIHDVGYLGQGLVGSPAAIVLCSEMIGYVKRLTRGLKLTHDHMAMEVISRIGPGGNFLADPHTLHFYREEQWQPKFSNRANVEVWQGKGGKSCEDIVKEKTKEILKTHRPEPLSSSILNSLAQISRRAQVELGRSRMRV